MPTNLATVSPCPKHHLARLATGEILREKCEKSPGQPCRATAARSTPAIGQPHPTKIAACRRPRGARRACPRRNGYPSRENGETRVFGAYPSRAGKTARGSFSAARRGIAEGRSSRRLESRLYRHPAGFMHANLCAARPYLLPPPSGSSAPALTPPKSPPIARDPRPCRSPSQLSRLALGGNGSISASCRCGSPKGRRALLHALPTSRAQC